MKPLKHGKEIDLVEIGANWYVDDLPPMMFMKKVAEQPRLRQSARHRGAVARPVRLGLSRDGLWRVPFTIHPDVSGRPQVILMLERLIEHINGHDGVSWLTFEEIAEDFRKRYPVRRRQAAAK